MPKRPKREILTIEKPPDWAQEDWDALSPTKKAQYATNPHLFKPGESGKKRKKAAPRPPGRPRKDGLPPISQQQRAVVLAEAGVEDDAPPVPAPAGGNGEVQTVAFEVEEAESIRDAIELNGPKLIMDAYKAAARARTSGDPFDKAIYLTLIGKAHPMATIGGTKKAMSGEAKRRKKALEAIIAQHLAQDAQFTPVPKVTDGPQGAHEQAG